MPKLAANLSMLFTEVDFFERFTAAAECGFKAVEYPRPYGLDKRLLKQKLVENQLTQVLINLPAGSLPGDRGIACHPTRRAEFEDGVAQAMDYATTLGCKQVNCSAGIPPPDCDQRQARETLILNLQTAAARLKLAGIKLLIEPINSREAPGVFLTNVPQAIDIISAVGSDNLFLQYDIYHMQIMGGDLAPTIKKHLAQIAHIQMADTPGRHEPGTGEINFDFLLDYIDKIGYQGWVSCEYKPLGKTQDSLGWAKRYLQ